MHIPDGVTHNIVGWEEDQRMAFHFDFSMPIQDTFTLTRDPNRFPTIYPISNDSAGTSSSPPDPPRPNRLATAHVDVQNYIMAFLSMEDLSILMRTCRYFLDACMLALCSRSNDIYFDPHMTRLPSFRRFLRINAGPSSRAHLIRELCIYASGSPELRYIYEPTDISLRKEWSAALLDILRHCHNVRRLRMYKWFLHDISFPLLVKTISSSLPHLEELTMPVPYGTDAVVLRRLARLPLRSFSFLKYPTRKDLLDTYISLDVLPRSLTELDIHRSPPCTDIPFLAVQKLGIRDTALTTFVANATAVFPNVSHLVLRQQEIDFMRQVSYNRAPLEDARARNMTQWQSEYRNAWSSVSAIWTEDPSFLYMLGFSRPVASVSVPMGEHVSEKYIPPALADTSPSFLELRIDMDMFQYRQKDWQHVFTPSIRRLTLLLYTRNLASRQHRVSYVLKCFWAMLPGLASLTHLLVRFAPIPQQPGSELHICSVYSFEMITQIMHGIIQKHLGALAITGTSLRWIGYEVFAWGIKSWDISRTGGSSSNSGAEDEARRAKSVKLVEMGESESVGVTKREGMNVFKDVRPTLVLVR